MGMYTQYRGWLCLDSISGYNTKNAKVALDNLREEFKKRPDLGRTFVASDCWIQEGSNGSLWLFFGSEHKDYDDSMEQWIKAVVGLFPNSEGRIDVQYEGVYPGEDTHCFQVREGKIEKVPVKAWTKGYGLDWALNPGVKP